MLHVATEETKVFKSGPHFQITLTKNAKISRSAESRANANVQKFHSNFVSTIVKDSYLQMCVKMWDGAGGLSGYLERLLLCSRLGTISR